MILLTLIDYIGLLTYLLYPLAESASTMDRAYAELRTDWATVIFLLLTGTWAISGSRLRF